jgi:hypothetical protein
VSADRDTTRIVRSWLRADEHESADRVLGAVLDQLDTTPQRGRTLPPLPIMSRFAKLLVGAATLGALTVVGVLLLAGPIANVGPSIPSSGASTEASNPSPSPAIADQWVRGADPRITATVEVPDGWTNTGHAVTTGSGSTHAGISFWTIKTVYADPCSWESSEVVTVPADTGEATSVVSALSTAWEPASGGDPGSAPSLTEPRDATLGGHAGLYAELTPPSATDFVACDGGAYRLWLARDDAARLLQAPGRVLRLWFLEVGSQVLVVDVTYTPVTDQSPEGWDAVLGQLEALIATVEIRSSEE